MAGVSGVKMIWMGKAVEAQAKVEAGLKLKLAGQLIADQTKRNIGVSTRSNGPSKPGAFPHKDTGKLQQSIFASDVEDLTVNIGSPLDYALELELGTDKKPARPFLRRTFDEMLPAVKKIMS